MKPITQSISFLRSNSLFLSLKDEDKERDGEYMYEVGRQVYD